ncbi:MAG: hypothetical protein EOL97_14325 [Spirochaetia bacterium]|nr:hypothetical protein [Spirochaetia bacterium]
MKQIDYELYKKAIIKYGSYNQIIKSVEELTELNKELLDNSFGADNIEHISEEMADVEIMLEQLKIIYNNIKKVKNYKQEKLERLRVRINE